MNKTDFSHIAVVGTITSIVYSEINQIFAFKLQTKNQHYLYDDSDEGVQVAKVTTSINGVTKMKSFSTVEEGNKIAITGTLNSKDDGQLFIIVEEFCVIS